MEQKNPIQSAERIFQVLELLAEKGPTGLMELSGTLNLHKSTVHRLLMSLHYMGYVRQDKSTGKYALTFKIVDLSSKVLANQDVLSMTRSFLERLAEACKETVHFVQREGTEVVYIAKVESQSVKNSAICMASHIGLARPMYCSGVGKAMLAELDPDEVRRIWDASVIEAKTPYTITSYEELLRELELIREQGYALDNEENELGVRCIAASVASAGGTGKYAFSISAPVGRMPDDRITELARIVLKMKEILSVELGAAL